MALLDLIEFPSPILKNSSKEVGKIDSEILSIVDDMIETMYYERGVGLSAVQVGVLKRIVVMDVSYKIETHCHEHSCDEVIISEKNPMVLINPEITWKSDEKSTFNEGCLSFPGIRAEIERPKEVEVTFVDRDGNKKSLKMSGLMSTCVQHEVDHTNGIVFVDHLSKLKRDITIKKIKKLSSKN